MQRYCVYLPDVGPREAQLEQAVFVRDGFSLAAVVFGAFYLLAKGHLVLGLGFLALQAAIAAAIGASGPPPEALGLALLPLSILFGLETATLRGFALRARRHRLAGIVLAPSEDVAETLFFRNQLEAPAEMTLPREKAPSVQQPPPDPAAISGVMGLFPRGPKPVPGVRA